MAQSLQEYYKGILSVTIYIIGIGLSLYNSSLPCGLYIVVAIMGQVPHRQDEKIFKQSHK